MAAGATYEPIATTTLGSAASSITFSSIPSTYTDLKVVLVCTTSAVDDIKVNFNGDTATNYSGTWFMGTGSSVLTNRYTNRAYLYLTATSGTSTTIPELFTLDIFSYAGSAYKTCLETNIADNNGTGGVSPLVHLWRSTAAINQITLSILATANFATGTTATLYGIKAA